MTLRLHLHVFRLVYDRETGKPKGYGFCEYQDQETALSAMRNLNGREFSGRALRVDNAASEKNKEELKSKDLIRAMQLEGCKDVCTMFKPCAVFVCRGAGLGTGSPIIESPYGDTVQPHEAPESISRAVASLPPEQMFELMKQMKVTITCCQSLSSSRGSFCLFCSFSPLIFLSSSVCRTARKRRETCFCRTLSWPMLCCRPRWSCESWTQRSPW